MKKIKKLLCALLVMLAAVTMLSEPFQVEPRHTMGEMRSASFIQEIL